MATENPTQNNDSLSAMLKQLQCSGTDAHTRKSKDDICRDLHIGPIERLLLWLAKTDYYVLSLSTFHTRLTLASLGMMVIFTSVLAFASSYYAAYSTLINPETPFRWLIAIAIALIYSFGILIIDREIVGSITKKSLFIRLFFAVFIATAISWPVKLKFFEGRIDAEVTKMVEQRNTDKIKKISQLRETGNPERLQQREIIKRRIEQYDQDIESLTENIYREEHDPARGAFCGPRCKEFREKRRQVQEKKTQAEQELKELSTLKIPPKIQSEIDKLQKEIDDEKQHSYDFLSKWEALERIKEQSGREYKILSYFMITFFMLLELIPLMLKLSIGKTEYHYYLESRNNLNNQKIISLTNLFIEAMQANRFAVLEMIPVEITDLIAAHIEDEASGGNTREIDLKNLTGALREILKSNKDSDTDQRMDRSNTAPLPPQGDGGDDLTIDEPPPPAKD